MILDKDGKPIEEKKEPHKFGEFKIPADCHLAGNLGSGGSGYFMSPYGKLDRSHIETWMRDNNNGTN